VSSATRAIQLIARALFRTCLVDSRDITSSAHFNSVPPLRSVVFSVLASPHILSVSLHVLHARRQQASGEAGPPTRNDPTFPSLSTQRRMSHGVDGRIEVDNLPHQNNSWRHRRKVTHSFGPAKCRGGSPIGTLTAMLNLTPMRVPWQLSDKLKSLQIPALSQATSYAYPVCDFESSRQRKERTTSSGIASASAI
jgi:hypothetical protein